MPLEIIHKNVRLREDEINSGQVSIDKALDDIYKVCYGQPKVSTSDFLSACRTVDPNFGPITSAQERQERARLTEKVREEFRKQAIRNFTAVDPVVNEEYKEQFGSQINREHYILFRGLDLEQQREMAQKLGSGDKEFLRDIFVNRVLNKKDELLALRSLSDAELAERYFDYIDELDLVFEMQMFQDLGYTPEQQEIYDELFANMVPLKNLEARLDVVAGGYYADYPCERMEMKLTDVNDFLEGMRIYCKQRGELNGKGKGGLMGPTMEFVSNVTTLRSNGVGVLMMDLEYFVKDRGAEGPKACIWADESGRPGIYTDVMDALNQQKILFVEIPGAGLKAVRNGGTGFANCKPVEATREEVRQHMIRAVEKGAERVDAANPFFLAKFTGSSQYNQMAAQHKAAKELIKELEFPLSAEKYQEAKETIEALQMATGSYLAYKMGQNLEMKDGMPVGRSANEKRRLAAAADAVELAESLEFLLQYQQNSVEASRTLQNRETARLDKIAAKRKAEDERLKQEGPKLPKEYQGDELSKSTKADLLPKVKVYEDIPPVPESTAGPAMNTLQREVPDAVRQLATFGGMTKRLSEDMLVGIKANLARVVLFDYVLRERVARQGEAVDGKVPAGPVEQALNDKRLDPFRLARSPAFNKLLGPFNPARAEAFLNNNESKNGLFNDVVLGMLAPVKANVMGDQAVQAQPTAVMGQPKVQVEAPKPAVKSGP